jgi:hypothetical protein
VSSGDRKVWIAVTTENMKVLMGRCGVIESHVRA